MAQPTRVYLFKIAGLIDSYKVYPAVTILKKNDSIELVNCTDDDARWDVPAGVLQASAVSEPVDRHTSRSKTATIDGPRAAEYEVHVDGKKAHAHSDPVIIIDP